MSSVAPQSQRTEPLPGSGPAATVHTTPQARTSWFLRVRELGVIVALVLLLAGTALGNHNFLSGQNVGDLLLSTSILALLAVGQAVVIITRNVDLSVGSVLGISAFAVGKLFQSHAGVPILLVAVVGIAVGVVCGMLNGALVSLGRVPALVVTLGTLYIIRGIDYSWASGQQVNAADMPDGFLSLGTDSLLGVPLLAIFALVVTIAVGYYLRSYRTGRELYAIGSDGVAAELSGINVTRRVFWAFTLMGGLAGAAGVLYAARFGTIDATAGTGQELGVVAAAVVGGVAISGGVGTAYGAALGALLLTTISSSLAALRVNQFWQQAIVGALILAAIGLDRLVAARVAARLRGSSAHGA